VTLDLKLLFSAHETNMCRLYYWHICAASYSLVLDWITVFSACRYIQVSWRSVYTVQCTGGPWLPPTHDECLNWLTRCIDSDVCFPASYVRGNYHYVGLFHVIIENIKWIMCNKLPVNFNSTDLYHCLCYDQCRHQTFLPSSSSSVNCWLFPGCPTTCGFVCMCG